MQPLQPAGLSGGQQPRLARLSLLPANGATAVLALDVCVQRPLLQLAAEAEEEQFEVTMMQLPDCAACLSHATSTRAD